MPDDTSHLSPPSGSDISSAITRLSEIWPERHWRVEQSLAGLGNRLWRVGMDEQPVVVRLNSTDLSFCSSQRYEHQIWSAAASQDLAPELLHWDNQINFSLSRWAGETPQIIDSTSLVKLLVEFHRLPINLPKLDCAETIESYLAGVVDPQCQSQLIHIPKWLDWLKASDLPDTLCHMDVHRDNLLVDCNGDWRLIDFEYCHQANPLFDLVPLIVDMDATDGMKLWTQYLGQYQLLPTESELQALRGAACLHLLMSAAWAEQMIRVRGGCVYSETRDKSLRQLNIWQDPSVWHRTILS